jgi:hypothetical protein
MTKYTSAVSTATIYAPSGQPNTVAAQATLNISSAQTQSFVAGSAVLLNSGGGVIKQLGDVTAGGGGVDLGAIGASVTEYVKFRTKVSCPETPPPTPQPSYACTMLDVKADQNRTATITAFTTEQANGATFDSAVIDWGDNSAKLTTAQVVGQTHSYEKAGTYTIMATAKFKVGNEIKTATSANCQKSVTFTEKNKKPPVVTNTTNNINNNSNVNNNTSVSGGSSASAPSAGGSGGGVSAAAAPSTLVNTGPGELLGVFTGTSLLGAFGYNRFLSRRLRA